MLFPVKWGQGPFLPLRCLAAWFDSKAQLEVAFTLSEIIRALCAACGASQEGQGLLSIFTGAKPSAVNNV